MKPILDGELIEQLREVMEDDFGLLLETYLRESELQLNAVKASLEAQDFGQLSQDAHSLKGSCGNIGATDLAKTCATIEANPSAEFLSVLVSQFGEVRGAVEDLHRLI